MRFWENSRATRFSPAVIPDPARFARDESAAEGGVIKAQAQALAAVPQC